ncbi:hypothetical protein DFP93_11535 [Aneurinibacillus soli]|uniref:Uncharacterized protein n=1 Tax=Aneurinibacillus soli TaxID=1500254 RepID=A0A0U4WM06_9BACL|nr:hypothetical protein [Aneurinibacillus soli]PYE59877.1 hypothetical protein DFP93_11535 [Aneurinibacillus soli]BAU29401.1 hypothetical protein CB4_03601 [Aneurinibacillus soli]
MRVGKKIAAVLLSMTMLSGAVGCSTADSGTSTVQSQESKQWISKQTAVRQQSITQWKKTAADKTRTSSERALASFAVNALSNDMKPLIEANDVDRQALLRSLASQKPPSAPTGLPALSSLTIESVNQLDQGKTMYTIRGTIFTSVPDKLYPITLQIRMNKSGQLEFSTVG